MKRWTLRILICLIFITGGAITTVAVAFAAATWAYGDFFAMDEFDRRQRRTIEKIFFEQKEVSQSWWFGHEVRAVGARWRFFSPHHSGPVLVMAEFGWPMSAFRTERTATFASHQSELNDGALHWISANVTGSDERKSGIFGGWGITDVRRPLPESVDPRGFAIDTLFYAAIWGGVFFGFASAKRAIRRKRGRCPRCGYDLRGHRHQGTEASRHQGLAAGCPECGWGREKEGTEARSHEGTK